MNIHIIACGGAVMHNIAIALHQSGNHVTGSDDEIFEPALSRLKKNGILPNQTGWFPEKITSETELVILGMHARADNPELARARELGVKINSFPEFVYEHARNKTRVVVAGSHGKTTTTAMIMHVLRKLGRDFDYLVGAQLEGFDTMVRFSDAPLMIIEGDEYLTSAMEPVSKFLKYKPEIALITGIAWDHINVFPTFGQYLDTFRKFIETLNENARLFWFGGDTHLEKLCASAVCHTKPYNTPSYHIRNGKPVVSKNEKHTLEIFGEHNLQNAEGASLVCQALGIPQDTFYNALSDFSGTAKRLEKVFENDKLTIYRDFAHSPSKVEASTKAVREKHPDAELMAVLELHTFSSLNRDFLPHYRNTLKPADFPLVYFNPHVFEMKKMQMIEKKEVEHAFGSPVAAVSTTETLQQKVRDFSGNVSGKKRVLLLMSSGNFDNTSLW